MGNFATATLVGQVVSKAVNREKMARGNHSGHRYDSWLKDPLLP